MMVTILQYIHFMLQTRGYNRHIKLWSIKCASQRGCRYEIISVLLFVVILLPTLVKPNGILPLGLQHSGYTHQQYTSNT